MAGQDGDGDEATHEQDVKNDGGESEEGDATEAAGDDGGSDCVEDCNARDSLDGLFPRGNALIAVGAHAEEVRVNSLEVLVTDCTRRERT